MTEGTPLLASLDARIEAAIFAYGGPVEERELARLLPDGVDIAASLQRISDFWKGRGVEIVRGSDGWRARPRTDLVPRPEDERSRKLSSAAVATLAVIAMHQPVTIPQIETVRGVKLARGIIEGLRRAGLIVEMGRMRGTGQPVAYGVTVEFLERFDLDSLSDMPTSEEAFMLDLATGD